MEEADPFMVHISPYFTLQQRLHARTPPPSPAPAQPRAGEGEEGGFRVSGPHVPVPGDLTSCRSVAQSCPTLCSPLDCSTPGPLSFTVSRSLLKLTSIESVMPSTHFLLSSPSLSPPLKSTNSKINQNGKTTTAEIGSAGGGWRLLRAGPCVTARVARPRGQPGPGSSPAGSTAFLPEHGSACSGPRLSVFLLTPLPQPTTTKLVAISTTGGNGGALLAARGLGERRKCIPLNYQEKFSTTAFDAIPRIN